MTKILITDAKGKVARQIDVPDGQRDIKTATPAEWDAFVKEARRQGLDWRDPRIALRHWGK